MTEIAERRMYCSEGRLAAPLDARRTKPRSNRRVRVQCPVCKKYVAIMRISGIFYPHFKWMPLAVRW